MLFWLHTSLLACVNAPLSFWFLVYFHINLVPAASPSFLSFLSSTFLYCPHINPSDFPVRSVLVDSYKEQSAD